MVDAQGSRYAADLRHVSAQTLSINQAQCLNEASAEDDDFCTLCHSAGIHAIVLRPTHGVRRSINEALHIALLALAGAFQGTHVTLELRARDKHDLPWEMEEEYWMASVDGPHPGMQRSLQRSPF
jgi:hypothetical protein